MITKQTLLNQLFWLKTALLHRPELHEFWVSLFDLHSQLTSAPDSTSILETFQSALSRIKLMLSEQGFDFDTEVRTVMKRNGYTADTQMHPVLDVWFRE